MAQGFVLLLETFDDALGIAAGADQLLLRALELFPVGIENGFFELEFLIEILLAALRGFGEQQLEAGDVGLLGADAVLDFLDVRQQLACRRRHRGRMEFRFAQGRGEGQVHFVVGDALGFFRKLALAVSCAGCCGECLEALRRGERLVVHSHCAGRHERGQIRARLRGEPVPRQDHARCRDSQQRQHTKKKSPRKRLHGRAFCHA